MSSPGAHATPTTRPRSVFATLTILAVLLAGCGDSDSGTEAGTTPSAVAPETTAEDTPDTTAGDTDAETPTIDPTPTEPAVDEDTTADDRPTGLAAACSATQRATGGEYVVTEIPVGDPDGGLVARRLPGASEERIDVLAEGTIVDSYADDISCAVTPDGATWWEIGTAQLATGGWVNSRFLTEFGPFDGQDDFDLTLAQIACVYEGNLGACDLLETFGYPAADNYGLGNSYTQAPDDVVVADCDAGDQLACAEQASRGGQ